VRLHTIPLICKPLSGTKNYVYDGAAILQELNVAGTVTSRYVHGPGVDEPWMLERGTSRYYYTADSLGSITGVLNSAGTKVETNKYSAFGENTFSSALGQPFGFTGREYDFETGLYYYRARYYEPKFGRFISEDPIRFAGGMNFYAYVGNNPVTYRDPLGLLNPAKAAASVLSAANAGRLYASGGLKLTAAAVFAATGIGTPAGLGTAAWGAWNIKSATSAQRAAHQLINEAAGEQWSDATWKNLYGALPFGTHYDDRCEPGPPAFFRKEINERKRSFIDYLSELGKVVF
jgi:RHS repeat-associated protein